MNTAMLSSLRAASVARIFVDELEFPSDRISVGGYADNKPVATNRTAEGRRLNRRVEIKVQYDE